MPPTAFASSEPLDREQLGTAPIRYPRPSRLATPLRIGGAKAQKAAETLGLETVGDLLEHLPRDRREARAVAELVPGESATVVVEVRSITSRSVRRRGMRPLVEATVGDHSGLLKATFFNQPWLAKRYPPGTRLVLHGSLDARRRLRVQGHASTSEQVAGNGAGAVAHYPTTEGLSSTQILALAREHAAAVADVLEPLPAGIRAAEGIPDRPAALASVHFPDGSGDSIGRSRLAFEELLLLQLALLRRRAVRQLASAAPEIGARGEETARWLSELLPFSLTDDQRAALERIDRDLEQPLPMQRLLMGEVGSGKTVVALYAMLRAVEHGMQAALMAPTETLAEQHFNTIQMLMPGELVPIGLLTGSTPARRRRELLGRLESGELPLVVGTHALIEAPVRFARLAVAVVDEQHRFGVRQRAALDAKGRPGASPHVLHMTATPIPRNARPRGIRRPRLHGAARAAPGQTTDRDPRLLDGARAGAGVRKDPRGAPRRASGVHRLPAGR